MVHIPSQVVRELAHVQDNVRHLVEEEDHAADALLVNHVAPANQHYGKGVVGVHEKPVPVLDLEKAAHGRVRDPCANGE